MAGNWNPNWGPQFGGLPLAGGGSTGSLKEWIDTLAKVPEEVPPSAERVVSKGALNIKNEARDLISGRRHLPHYPNSISYDIEHEDAGVTARIGPDKDKSQGPLGNILEYGSVNNAPIPHLGPALDAEEPRFVQAVEDFAVRLLS